MAWTTLLVANTADGLIGFCGNVYVDDPTLEMTVGGSSTNPTLAQFNSSMVLGADAINMFDTNQGATTRINITDSYYIQCRRGTGGQQSYRWFESNIPDFSGVLSTSPVLNNMYYSLSYNDETHVGIIGLFMWAIPTNYSSRYIPLGNPSNNVYNVIKGLVPPPPPTDPYADGGYSTGTDTGTGTFDDTSDAIADPSTPTLSPSIGNFVNQYVVSPTALSNFGTWLYSGGNIFDNLAKVFQSPMEAIINVGILPYKPTFDPNAYVDIKVGGLNSNVQARKITNNYEVVDMGTIDFDPFYGSALDYNPYTKCYIYLPYCGTFPLNVDEIMGHKISLKYYCDSLSGDCVAVISDEERVLEQFRGNTFIQVPITARDFSSIYTNALNSAISLAAGIATVAATGGVSAPVAVGMGTSMASNAMNSKTHYSRSGGFSGVAGFMSVQKPYVILTIPRQCLPDKQNEFQGYPLFVTKTLSDCSGFTKVYEIHLDGLNCTDAEAKEIYELLKGGVVL